MKNKRLFSFLAVLILTFSILIINTYAVLDREETEIPYGQNATAQLPMFSKTYLRVHEGSKIEFSVVDPDNSAILIENNVIIKNINKTYVDVLLSTDSSEYKEVTFYARQPYKINYTYNFTPSMSVELIVNHYDENPAKRNVVFYFLVTSFKTPKSDFSQIKSRTIDFSQVSPGAAPDIKDRTNEVVNKLLKWLIISIGIIILLLFILRKKS